MCDCSLRNEQIGQLYREMYETLYVYAKNVLSDPHLAEEATQDVFCIACAKSDELLQSNNPKGWLMQTLKNMIRNIKRQRTKMKKLAIISLDFEGFELLGTYDETDVDILYGDVSQREDFQLFKLIAIKDYTMKEAADEFGISVEACKKRVQRIRAYLCKKFSQ
ncbi:MAG: sigma-70 family RNA polymerase sigma factor [Oscillospiraceae bacterium]|nr:sigma-70 family RNA polymerase sigma factor [Oscillospiraceae bacterium]